MEIKKRCEIYLDSFRTEVNTRFEKIESELDKIKQEKAEHPTQDFAHVVDSNNSAPTNELDPRNKRK